MANWFTGELTLFVLSIILSDQFVVICRGDDTLTTNRRRWLRKKLPLRRSVPDNDIFGEVIKTDDLIRTPYNPNGQMLQISPEEQDRLKSMYGPEVIKNHRQDLAVAKSIGNEQGEYEHKVPWGNDEPVTGVDKEVIDEARLDALRDGNDIAEANLDASDEQKRLLDPTVAKNLLEGLLTRSDSSEEKKVAKVEENEPVVTLTRGHCTLHGLWLSTVAGAAIELIPVQQEGHIEIKTKIFDLPGNPEKGMINSQWTGKGVISSESPTTITIVFQEHIVDQNVGEVGEKEADLPSRLPKTAVFVGQCLVCENSPVLQGTWIVFPNTQSCLPSSNDFIKSHPESRPPLSSDTLYLMQRD